VAAARGFELEIRRVRAAHLHSCSIRSDAHRGHSGREGEGRGAVAQQRLIIWFPHGDAEFYTRLGPTVGDRITRRGRDWIVARVQTHIDDTVRVTVMATEVVRDDSWPTPYEFAHPERLVTEQREPTIKLINEPHRDPLPATKRARAGACIVAARWLCRSAAGAGRATERFGEHQGHREW
jgi:hypothetical protein